MSRSAMEGGRKALLTPFGVMALVLALSSVAYACTTFKGDMTVSGTSSSTGTGNNSGMGYCQNITPGKAGVTKGTAFTVSVAPSTNSNCAAQLSNMTADVNYMMGAGPPTTTDCMDSFRDMGGEKQIGSMSISNGSGSGSYTIPTTQTKTGDVQICVSSDGGGTGMQIPGTLA